MTVAEEGVYTFSVIVSGEDGSDERTIAEIPLNVNYSRVAQAPGAIDEQPVEATPV